ncbi:MAG: hypothetical protein ABEJ35_05860 [Halobacteriaceae archaeon]
MRVAALLSLLLLAGLAGCQAPSGAPGGSQGTTTPAGEGVLQVRFEPGYNATRVLNRVERLRGLTATGPIVVHEYPRTPTINRSLPNEFLGIRPAGALALGLASNATVSPTQALGYTVRRGGEVHIYLMSRAGLATYNSSQELIFVHELVHALQYQHGLVGNGREKLRQRFANWTTDTRLVARAMVEGDAMVTTVAYQRLYAPNQTYASFPRPLPPRGSWQSALVTAPYAVGLEYFRTIGQSPSTRSAAIRNPPNSSRYLLHPNASPARTRLPPSSGTVGSFDRLRSDTVGELVIRRALRLNGLSARRAREAARGWVEGRMTYYDGPKGTVVRWTTRWTSEGDAVAFVDAYTTAFDRRNASRADGLLIVPATATTPRTALRVVHRGSRVVILAARDPALIRAFQNASRPARVTPARSDGGRSQAIS